MSPQIQANLILLDWQRQREARISPEQRKIEDEEFQRKYEKDLAVLRQLMERA